MLCVISGHYISDSFWADDVRRDHRHVQFNIQLVSGLWGIDGEHWNCLPVSFFFCTLFTFSEFTGKDLILRLFVFSLCNGVSCVFGVKTFHYCYWGTDTADLWPTASMCSAGLLSQTCTPTVSVSSKLSLELKVHLFVSSL